MPKARCTQCGLEANADSFNRALEHYHDLRCPNCGSAKINTSDILKHDTRYKYGSDNTLVTKWVIK